VGKAMKATPTIMLVMHNYIYFSTSKIFLGLAGSATDDFCTLVQKCTAN